MKDYFIYGILLPACFLLVFIIPVRAAEPGNTAEEADVILLNNEEAQHYSFEYPEDEDWVKFYGLAGQTYEIEVTNVGANCDVVIQLYDTDGMTSLEKADDNFVGEDESLKKWVCPQNGIYYVRFYNNLDEGGNTDYEIRVFNPDAESIDGFIRGTVTDLRGAPIKDAKISTDDGTSGLSDKEGKYTISQRVGTWCVTAQADGYKSLTIDSVIIGDGETEIVDFRLKYESAKGDIDTSGITDLTDAIIVLQVMAGLYPENVHLTGDVNHDKRIGLEEAVYILQIMGGEK